MKIIYSTRGTGDDSTRSVSWKYAKICRVGGSGVMLELENFTDMRIGCKLHIYMKSYSRAVHAQGLS